LLQDLAQARLLAASHQTDFPERCLHVVGAPPSKELLL